MLTAIVVAVLLLAYANGANDNFKGVATLFGSATASYRRALAWGTLTTLAGSSLALLVAHSCLGWGAVRYWRAERDRQETGGGDDHVGLDHDTAGGGAFRGRRILGSSDLRVKWLG